MLSSVKTVERELARRLRREEGASVKEIARRVGVSVSSVSIWVRDVELSNEHEAALRLRNRMYEGQSSGRAVAMARRRAQRIAAQEEGRALARAAEPLHVAGCMLHWAEGTKSRNVLQFCNADPEMVRFFVRFVRTYFDVRDEDVRITCYLYADHLARQVEIEDYWLGLLGLTRDSLYQSIIDRISRSSRRKRFNVLPHGTCRVVVNRTHVVQHVWGAIQEYAGFEREAWLE
jgi:AcrR family transcriptional regulator